MQKAGIFEQMRPLIADSLALKAADVTLHSRLINDLGADSLDLIDIIFGLEKKFGIKMRDGELDFLSRLDFSSPQVMREGYLTEATLQQLQSWLPELNQVPRPLESHTRACIFVHHDRHAVCSDRETPSMKMSMTPESFL